MESVQCHGREGCLVIILTYGENCQVAPRIMRIQCVRDAGYRPAQHLYIVHQSDLERFDECLARCGDLARATTLQCVADDGEDERQSGSGRFRQRDPRVLGVLPFRCHTLRIASERVFAYNGHVSKDGRYLCQ